MSKITFYKCNLCMQNMDKKDMYSFYWKSDKTPQGFILNENTDASDKHICVKCIDVIKNN